MPRLLKQASKRETPDVPRDKAGFKKRAYSGLEKLNGEYRAIVQPVLGKRGFSGLEIIESWTDIVGEGLSVGIRPEKLQFQKGSRTNGVLYVKSAGGAFALLCEHNKAVILDRINTYFGYPAVSQIKILQGKLQLKTLVEETKIPEMPSDEKELLKEKAALIEDKDLQEILYQTGVAFWASKQKKS